MWVGVLHNDGGKSQDGDHSRREVAIAGHFTPSQCAHVVERGGSHARLVGCGSVVRRGHIPDEVVHRILSLWPEVSVHNDRSPRPAGETCNPVRRN